MSGSEDVLDALEARLGLVMVVWSIQVNGWNVDEFEILCSLQARNFSALIHELYIDCKMSQWRCCQVKLCCYLRYTSSGLLHVDVRGCVSFLTHNYDVSLLITSIQAESKCCIIGQLID